MSDKELIIRSLEKVDRRIRSNRLIRELAFALSIFLLVPVLFKVLDLFRPFRGWTVVLFLSLWLVGVISYAVWRISLRTTLGHTAAALDHQASLQDEITSAYWFVTSPHAAQRSSDWVELQVRRAAQRAGGLNIERLYPRVVPRTWIVAAGLFVLLVGLNFVPLSLNHNWVYMQAAPAFSLTTDEQRLINETKKLLKRAQKMDQSELAGKLEQIMQDLQEGKIDAAEAMKQLEELKNTLNEGNLDTANINEGLDEMSQDLSGAKEAKDVADAMASHDLQATADELKKLAEDLKQGNPDAQKDLQEALQQASENPNPAMQSMAKDMKDASDALAKNDQKAAQDALNKAAKDAQDLQDKVQDQQAKNSASQEIQNLQDSLRQRQQQQQQGGQQQSQAGQPQASQSQGQKGEKGSSEAQQADDNGGSEAGEAADGEAQEGKEGQQAGKPSDNAQAGGAGKGQNPSGAPQAPMNIIGQPTKLNVKLEQEKLDAQSDGGTPQNLEEASKQERSKLDYRNVRSELSPAQKDVLNQDKIPWELKGLIKNYFQAIRPQQHGKP